MKSLRGLEAHEVPSAGSTKLCYGFTMLLSSFQTDVCAPRILNDSICASSFTVPFQESSWVPFIRFKKKGGERYTQVLDLEVNLEIKNSWQKLKLKLYIIFLK